MESESLEFDSALGGTEVLPHSANSLKFAASRSIEIAAMTESILRPSKTKLIFQSLPVHMRRRVMSHNSKRLPRRLREGHLEQMKKSGLPPKQKRPSRKYRRRPANLLEEYTRRQRRNIWLETHIWHAKRFHMIEKWGHRLAYRPCDKAFRACYRATSAHCLMQDISYYTTMQIKGSSDIIKDMFSGITESACGLGICAKAYLSGNREGTISLFMPNEYPFGYIGNVNFLWTSSAELWLFIHPSYAKQVESILIEIRNGSNNTNIECELNDIPKKRKLSNNFSEIELKIVTGLNRFRLTGPKSHAVLAHALQCLENTNNITEGSWLSHLINRKIELNLKNKLQYWSVIKSISSPAQLSPKIAVGLIVKDPRLSRPKKRTKAQNERLEYVQMSSLTNIPTSIQTSPLWDTNVRNIIKCNRITNAQFIEHITKTQLVPGEVNEDDPKLQPLPIVLIQRPGSQEASYKKIGYSSGWDIIIPPGYGLPFWLTFIMFGGRSGGLRETENMTFEMGLTYYSPDSNSGYIEDQTVKEKLRENYFKKPASKRVNYTKLSQPSPFICPWQILVNEWCETKQEKFFVLRDRKLINEIQENIKNRKRLSKINNMNGCLIAIHLQIIGKGSLQKHANICIPHIKDNKECNIVEPHHEDYNAKARREKKIQHKKLLKQLRRRRVKDKNKAESNNITLKWKKKIKQKEPSEYEMSMRELWLPTNIKTVRNAGVRETMGYVVHGAFSFTEAKSCGVGYVTYNALRTLMDSGIDKVLVRNTTSRVYRLSNFEIIKF